MVFAIILIISGGVYRYFNSLWFQLSLFRKDEVFEVNIIDLIALEVIKTFEGGLFQKLSTAKSLLTNDPNLSIMGIKSDEDVQREFEVLLGSASDANREHAKQILLQLFPAVAKRMERSWDRSDESDWDRARRICHPDYFDRYFVYALPDNDISEAEINALISNASNKEEFVGLFNSLRQRGLIAKTIDRLQSRKKDIGSDNAESFLTAMFDVSDDLPIQRDSFSVPNLLHQMYFVVVDFIKGDVPPDRRKDLVKNAVSGTSGLALPLLFVGRLGEGNESSAELEFEGIEASDITELQEECVRKIRDSALSSSLSTHPDMQLALSFWKDWCGNANESKEWVKSKKDSHDFVLAFLRSHVSRVIQSSKGMTLYFDLSIIERYISFGEIEPVAEELLQNDLSEEDREILMKFQVAIRRRRAGKPDFGWKKSMDFDED